MRGAGWQSALHFGILRGVVQRQAVMIDQACFCLRRLMFFEQAREQEEAKYNANKQDVVVGPCDATSCDGFVRLSLLTSTIDRR